MAFVQTTWNDDADPAITAAQLNRIEQGVADAHNVMPPWFVQIDALGLADVNSLNFGTRVADSASFFAGWRQSSGANGDFLEYDVVLSVGTWKVLAMGSGDTNRGRVGLMLDGVDTGQALDFYAAATSRNTVLGSLTFNVATSGKKRARFYANGKNASSGGYYLCLQQLVLLRTA